MCETPSVQSVDVRSAGSSRHPESGSLQGSRARPRRTQGDAAGGIDGRARATYQNPTRRTGAPAVMAETIPRVESIGTSRWRTISFAISPGMMKPITWKPGSRPLNGPRANSTTNVRVIATSIVTAKRRRPKRIVDFEAQDMIAAAPRAMPSVYATISGRSKRNSAMYPGTTTPPGESKLRSYQSMLTAIPMKTAVCKTSSLTPSVTTNGSPPRQCFDDAVPGIRDHVAAREGGPSGRRKRVEGLEDLPGRRRLHGGQAFPREAVPDRRAHERFRVAARHDDGTEVEAADRAVVAAVEEPDERAAVDFPPAHELRLEGRQRVDVVDPERAHDRIRARIVRPLEEPDRPEVGRRVQHSLDRAVTVEAEEIADRDGEGDVLPECDVRERIEDAIGDRVGIDAHDARAAALRLLAYDR